MSAEERQAVRADATAYTLDNNLPIPALETVEPGTNLLISGPALSGVANLADDLLAHGLGRGEHVVVLSTDRRGRRVLDRLQPERGQTYVVDCSGRSGHGSLVDTDRIKYVGSPGDLTGIGIGLVKCTRAIGHDAQDGVRLGTVSLTTMLQFASLERVFNFVHVLTGRVDATSYLGVATIDPTVHDERTVNTLAAQFDAIVDVRDDGDGRRVRCRGLPDVGREWHSL